MTATAVTLLSGAVLAAPAHAATGDEPAADGTALNFSVVSDEVGLPKPANPSDPAQISWGLAGDSDGGTAHHVVVGIDVSGIAAFSDFGGRDCPGDVCAWPAKDIAPDGFEGGVLDMNAKSDAALGTTGTARLTATSDDATVADLTVKVTVGKVGLVVDRIPQTDTAKPGTTLDAPITIANTGSLTAQGVDLRIATTPGLGFDPRFANCSYGTTDDVGQAEGQTLPDAVCHIATPVEPGKKYRLSTSLGIAVKRSALFEFVDYLATPVASAVPAPARAAANAPVLALVPDGAAPTDPGGTDEGLWVVNAVNTADIAVSGDTATAAPGDRVTLTAKVRDDGPAAIDLLTSDDQLGLLVDIPKGTTAVKVPEHCGPWTGDGMGQPRLGAPQYLCFVGSPFGVGQVASLPFTVAIGKDAPATTSGDVHAISVNGVELAYDTDKTNSTGQFTVHVKGAANAAGGASGSGGTGGLHPQGGSGAVAATASTHVTGALADTGADGVRPITWAAAASLTAGAVLVVAIRRRRHAQS